MFITPCSLTWVQVGSSKAGPQLLACYDRDVTRRKKMAPRVQRGEKKKKKNRRRGGSGRRHILLPPPRPPRSTPTAAVRGEPCAPARASGRERTCREPSAERRERIAPRNAPAALPQVCAWLRRCAPSSGEPLPACPLTPRGQVTPVSWSSHTGIRALPSLGHGAAPVTVPSARRGKGG